MAVLAFGAAQAEHAHTLHESAARVGLHAGLPPVGSVRRAGCVVEPARVALVVVMSRRTGMGLEEFTSACEHAEEGEWPRNYEKHIIGAPICRVCRRMWRRVHALDAPRTPVGEGHHPVVEPR